MTLFPSPTIARYTARLFVQRSLAFLALLVLVVMSLDVLGESGDILAVPGNDEADIWRYISLRLPQLAALFLPFAVLLGTLVTLMTLNSNSEVVIFKAAGISAHQILAPLIAAALGIAALNFAFNEVVLTRAVTVYDAWKRANYDPAAIRATTGSEVWVRSGGDLFHAVGVDGVGAATRLRDVDIYDRTDNRLVRIVQAAEARPLPDGGGWRLFQARSFTVATGRREVAPTLDWRGGPDIAQFTTGAVDADHLPFWELRPAIEALEAAGRPTGALRAALHHKVSGPLAAVLMPLLGAIAAFGLARSGRLFVRAVAGMLLGFAFFVADNFALAMADFGSLPPLAAAWAPFVLFFLIGEAVLLRSEE